MTDGNAARAVRDEDSFDVEAVAAWLDRGPIAEVRQYAGGASNLTYLLRYDGEEQPDLILRRPPVGAKAGGAHDMGREHDVQAALAPVFPYVATMVGHCTDETVIGSEFYVMEKVDGAIPRQEFASTFASPVTPEQADALCDTALDTLVALHAVDVEAVPALAAYAKGDGYVARQVGGWTRRFADARTDDTGDWDDILGWLDEHQPHDVAQRMIHNDFRLDNLVLDPDTLAVRAVLDWEMATIGDPLMDLGGALAYWVEAGDDEVFQMFRRQPTTTPGMWTRDRIVATYCERSGIEVPGVGWRFYEVFGLFRLAVIAQQIWYRYVMKQTTNEAYAVFGPAVGYLESRCRTLVSDA